MDASIGPWFTAVTNNHANISCDPASKGLLLASCSSRPSTAGDDELYTAQRPLPLAELHSAERPGGGVLALLKMALWHALWVEAPPAPGEGERAA